MKRKPLKFLLQEIVEILTPSAKHVELFCRTGIGHKQLLSFLFIAIR